VLVTFKWYQECRGCSYGLS